MFKYSLEEKKQVPFKKRPKLLKTAIAKALACTLSFIYYP